MDLYIGNISETTTEIDISQFLYQKLGVKEFSRVHIVHEEKIDDGHRFAVVGIEPEKKARNVIGKLNGMVFRGERLKVREYNYRTSNNERRALNWRNQLWEGLERRMIERRGGGLILETGASVA